MGWDSHSRLSFTLKLNVCLQLPDQNLSDLGRWAFLVGSGGCELFVFVTILGHFVESRCLIRLLRGESSDRLLSVSQQVTELHSLQLCRRILTIPKTYSTERNIRTCNCSVEVLQCGVLQQNPDLLGVPGELPAFR